MHSSKANLAFLRILDAVFFLFALWIFLLGRAQALGQALGL